MEISYKIPVEIELYEKVGSGIKEAMKGKKLSVKKLSQRLRDEGVFGSYATARRFVIDARNGYFNFVISNKSDLRKISLERIAYLFSAVEIVPDNEIIGIFKGLNPDFVYP